MPPLPDDGDKLNGEMSLEEKIAHLEKKFENLESKYNSLKAANGGTETEVKSEDGKKDSDTPDGQEESKKPEGRIRVVVSKYDPDTGERKDRDIGASPSEDGEKEKRVLLLRKYIDDNDGEIIIYDRNLLDLLNKLLAHYPDHYFSGETVTIQSPYYPFVHNWDDLLAASKEECKDVQEQQARSDLGELLEIILRGSGDAKLDEYLQARDSFNKQKSITFEALWTIFAPGTLVHGQIFQKQDQLFIVEDFITGWPRDSSSRRAGTPYYWHLKCVTYDFTGEQFQRRGVVLSIESYDGAKPISELPVHPWDYVEQDKRKAIEDKLVERGERFRKYCTADEDERMYSYTGVVIVDKRGFRGVETRDDSTDGYDSDYRRRRRSRSIDIQRPAKKAQDAFALHNSNVMVDFESYYRYGSDESRIGDTVVSEEIQECNCDDCAHNEKLNQRFKRYYDDPKSQEGKWERLQLMLCPPRLLGYVLKDKQWAQLAVDKLSPIRKQHWETVMKDLHLAGTGKGGGKETKELLYGLVRNHGMEASRENEGYEIQDIVPDKGKGLVILLYGRPGVGKTSTAQKIAEASRKPLFSIGVADVGTKAKQVEANLDTIFNLASRWKAILLIDEADVFLQSRNARQGPSAEGSALVSVFLRVLEYYKGILFLTTNQISHFDVAVQSRIHIALYYANLNPKQTSDIFIGFVRQYDESGLVKNFDQFEEYAEEELHKKGFDGRQIRNIVTTAMGFARGVEQSNMNIKHIRRVVNYVETFKDDLAGAMFKYNEAQKSASLRPE